MRMTKELRLCKIGVDLPVDKERTQSEDINMSRSRTSSGEYPAQNERSGIHGISEREKQPDDISEMGEHEVCISQPRILVQGILCRYSRGKHKCNKRVYSETVKARQRERAIEHV